MSSNEKHDLNPTDHLSNKRQHRDIIDGSQSYYKGEKNCSSNFSESNMSWNDKKRDNRQIAPSLEDYLAPGGCKVYRPREEWCNSQRILKDSPMTKITQKCELVQGTICVSKHNKSIARGVFPLNSMNDNNFGSYRRNNNNQLQPNVDKIQNNENNLSLYVPADNSPSALHKAIVENNTEAVLDLLAYKALPNIHGFSISRRNSEKSQNVFYGVTPLSMASHRGNLDLVNALFQYGANPLLPNLKSGSTPLIQAAHFGHVHVVKCILQYESHGKLDSQTYWNEIVNQSNHRKTTALMRACQEGHLDIVKLLISHGANVNATNKDQMTSLLLSSQRGHVDIVKILILNGAIINQRTKQKATALILASQRGHLEVVRVLLGNGAEINAKDFHGHTAKSAAKRALARNETFNDQNERKIFLSQKNRLETIENILSIDNQLYLIQLNLRIQRNFVFAKMYTLLQEKRADIACTKKLFLSQNVSIFQAYDLFHEIEATNGAQNQSAQAIILTMTLPALLMEHIAAFLPLPELHSSHISYLNKKMEILTNDELDETTQNELIASAFDLIEKLLAEGGLLHLCDETNIPCPEGFHNWVTWSSCGKQYDYIQMTQIAGYNNHNERPIQNTKEITKNYPLLCILSDERFISVLKEKLIISPYLMSVDLFENLLQYSNVVKLLRNPVVGCHFDSRITKDVLCIANKVLKWLKAIEKQNLNV